MLSDFIARRGALRAALGGAAGAFPPALAPAGPFFAPCGRPGAAEAASGLAAAPLGEGAPPSLVAAFACPHRRARASASRPH